MLRILAAWRRGCCYGCRHFGFVDVYEVSVQIVRSRAVKEVAVIGNLIEDGVASLSVPPESNCRTRRLIQSFPGGAGANVAVGIRRQGYKVRLYGHVGHDATGRRLERAMRTRKVSLSLTRANRTGRTICLAGPGSNA